MTLTFIPVNRPEKQSLRDQPMASHDVLDAAEILRLSAISMRKSAAELDRLADDLDPLPELNGSALGG